MESKDGQTRSREAAEHERPRPEPHETRLPFASEGLEPLRDSHC
jgi:hypothetical protein